MGKLAITDLASQLGLRAAYTKLATDWAKNAIVSDLYQIQLSALARGYAEKSLQEVQSSAELHQEIKRLMEEYGPDIWPRTAERPWLFKAGEHKMYNVDLYYDSDTTLLRDTLYQLAVKKITKQREHNNNVKSKQRESQIHLSGLSIRASSVASDVSWRPDSHSHSPSLTFRPQCFGTPAADGGVNHLDAAHLLANGVWLGDYNSTEDIAVENCISFGKLTNDYYDRVLKGLPTEDDAFPSTRSKTNDQDDVPMQCAVCQQGAKTRLMREDFLFQEPYGGDPDPNQMRRVWTFPCKLDNREVFAIIKSSRRMGPLTLWSFWKTEGGYTKEMTLANIPQAASRPSLPQSQWAGSAVERDGMMTRRSNVRGLPESSTDVLEPDSTRLIDMVNAEEPDGAHIIPSLSKWLPVNASQAAVSDASMPPPAIPKRTREVSAEQTGKRVRRSPNASNDGDYIDMDEDTSAKASDADAGAIKKFDSAYDVTPAYECRPVQDSIFRSFRLRDRPLSVSTSTTSTDDTCSFVAAESGTLFVSARPAPEAAAPKTLAGNGATTSPPVRQQTSHSATSALGNTSVVDIDNIIERTEVKLIWGGPTSGAQYVELSETLDEFLAQVAEQHPLERQDEKIRAVIVAQQTLTGQQGFEYKLLTQVSVAQRATYRVLLRNLRGLGGDVKLTVTAVWI